MLKFAWLIYWLFQLMRVDKQRTFQTFLDGGQRLLHVISHKLYCGSNAD